MSKKVVYIESDSKDPAFNLALEQYVFDCMPKEKEYFWLWQNDNTIVLGKHQNAVEEINQSYVKEQKITVVRRLSGGGAVYHDLGNVNFTFIADAGNMEKLNLQTFCLPVIDALKKIGVAAEVSGRNDMTIEGKKFSGNSQYMKHGRVMHHGTLMFDSNLDIVSEALKVSPDKYQSKGVKSVRARITNIKPYVTKPMGVEEFQDILKKNMIENREVEVYRLTESDMEEIRKIQRERYDTWEWNYGRSPQYSVQKKRRIEGVGMIEIYMNVEKGEIREYQSFGDYFGDGATDQLKQVLINCPLREEILEEHLKDFNLEACYSHLKKEDFVSLLLD